MADLRKPKMLLILDDEEFYQDLCAKLSPNGFEIFLAKDMELAQEFLTDTSMNLNAIFIGEKTASEKTTELVNYGHKHHTSVPIFFIHPDVKEIVDYPLDDMGVHGVVSQPKEVIDIIQDIEIKMKQFNFDKVIELGEATREANDAIEENLKAIKAQNFLSGTKSFFDVFVRIREGKFVKVLHAGDKFEPERINKYLEKGLESLYIYNDAHKHYLEFCDKLTYKIIRSNKVDDKVKITQTYNQGEETVNFLRDQGLDNESLEFATNYASNVVALLQKVETKNQNLKAIISNILNFDHTAGTTLMAGLIARAYGLTGVDAVERVGLGATLHDIGLNKLAPLYTHNESFKLFDEDLIEFELLSDSIPMSRRRELEKVYKEHAEVGAEMARELSNIDPVVIQIIGQHHMRNDGTGFPKLSKGSVINPLSQIVGLADEYSKLIKNIMEDRSSKADMAVFAAKTAGFSGQVGRAFSKVISKLK